MYNSTEDSLPPNFGYRKVAELQNIIEALLTQ